MRRVELPSRDCAMAITAIAWFAFAMFLLWEVLL
jgi:hypothetical protein